MKKESTTNDSAVGGGSSINSSRDIINTAADEFTTSITSSSTSSLLLLRVQERRRNNDNDNNYNLFVRLSPRIASKLWKNAVEKQQQLLSSSRQQRRKRQQQRQNHNGGGWDLLSQQQQQNSFQPTTTTTSSGIEFLPLEIEIIDSTKTANTTTTTTASSRSSSSSRSSNSNTGNNTTTNTNNIIYASYNGGDIIIVPKNNKCDSNAVVDDEFIDIPSCLLHQEELADARGGGDDGSSEGLGNQQWQQQRQQGHGGDQVVAVRVIPYVRDAYEVYVEPVTEIDWILLQHYSTWLEHGGLLKQVSIVSSNIVLPIRLGDDGCTTHNNGNNIINGSTSTATWANVRVTDCFSHQDKIRNAVAGTSASSNIWPEDDEDSKVDGESGGGKCMRLVADTRVVVESPAPAATITGHRRQEENDVILRVIPGLLDYYGFNYSNNNVNDINTKCNTGQTIPSAPSAVAAAALDTDALGGLINLVKADQCCAVIHPKTASSLALLALEGTVNTSTSNSHRDGVKSGSSSSCNTVDKSSSSSKQQQKTAKTILAFIEPRRRNTKNYNNSRNGDGKNVLPAAPAAPAPKCAAPVKIFESEYVPEDCIVLSPFTRIELNLHLFTDEVYLRLPPPLIYQAVDEKQELCLLGQKTKDLVLRGKVRVKIENVRLEEGSQRPSCPTWRYPDTTSSHCCSEWYVIYAETEMNYNDSASILAAATGLPASMSDLPLRIGSTIFQLPWITPSAGTNSCHSQGSRLFRLVAETQQQQQQQQQLDRVDDLFLLSGDIVSLLRMSLPSSFSGGLEPVMIHTPESSSSRYFSLLAGRLVLGGGLMSPPSPSSRLSSLFADHPSATTTSTTKENNRRNENANILICGGPGSGKTYASLLHAAVLGELVGQAKTFYLDARKLKDARGIRIPHILQELSRCFDDVKQCCASSPATLILDNFDELAMNVNVGSGGDEEGGADPHQVQQINPALIDQCYAIEGMLYQLCEDVKHKNNNHNNYITYVVTCSEKYNLSPTIRSMFGFDKENGKEVKNNTNNNKVIQLPLLSKLDRVELFLFFLQRSLRRQDQAWTTTTTTTTTSTTDTAKTIEDNGWDTGEPSPKLQEQFLLSDFGSKTVGYRPRDLEQVASRTAASMLLGGRASSATKESIHEATIKALLSYVPLGELAAAASVPSSSSVNNDPSSASMCTLSQVGGLFNAKRELKTTLLRPALYRRIYSKSKNRLPRGILLFGPPGCGKSYIVPALANECSYPLIKCRGPELLDKYIGASEMKIRELFARASSVAPSIIWFDEFDSLAPRRGSDSTGVTDRVVNQLLTFLDGVEDNAGDDSTVYVIATSSRPDKIDPALLRPGRLERHVYIGLPENDVEIKDILLKVALGYNVSSDVMNRIETGHILSKEFSKCDKWVNNQGCQLSAADMRAIFNSAQLRAAHEVLVQADDDNGYGYAHDAQVEKEAYGAGGVQIQIHHLCAAIEACKSSLPVSDREMLQAIYSKFQRGEQTIKDTTAIGPLKVALK